MNEVISINIDFTLIADIIFGVFLVMDILLLIGFIFAMNKFMSFRTKYVIEPENMGMGPKTLRKAVFEERWERIKEKADAGTQESVRLAIIEADLLVDSALKEIGLGGETMADRLSSLRGDDFKSLEPLWRAHKLRNNLVHTPGFILAFDEAHKVIADYERALKELGAL